MLRLLAALLICTPPAWAAPHLLVALDARIDTARALNVTPDQPSAPLPPSLLNPGAASPAQDLCDAIGKGAFPAELSLPVDHVEILSTLVREGLCSSEPG